MRRVYGGLGGVGVAPCQCATSLFQAFWRSWLAICQDPPISGAKIVFGGGTVIYSLPLQPGSQEMYVQYIDH